MIVRSQRNNLLMLDKSFIEDNRLSLTAKGIFAYLKSVNDEQEVTIEDLINSSNDDRNTIDNGLVELEQHGYLSSSP